MRTFRITLLLFALTSTGVAGFMLIEGWNFLDALYMSVITLSTVGFSEVHSLSDAGRWFVIGYLIVGLGVFFYGVAQIGEVVLQAQFGDWLERRKMEKTIRNLKDHYVVCGFGRMGRHLCQRLAARNLPFVIIDKDEDVLQDTAEPGWHWVVGDATEDRVLLDAGIERAKGLATVLSTDADNVYVVLSARLLAPKLQIVSRSGDEKGVTKLEKAGADRVVSVYAASATKMAHSFIHPNVARFLEVITTEDTDFDLAEIPVDAEAPYAGQKLADTDFSRRGIVIVGIRHGDGSLAMPPPSQASILAGDTLIALGKAEALESFAS